MKKIIEKGNLSYWVNEKGDVKRVCTGSQAKQKIMRLTPNCNKINRNGKKYYQIRILGNSYLKHRLVAHAYLGMDLDSELCVMHMDDNPENCHVSNLRVGTHGENMLHKYKQGFTMKNIAVIRNLINDGLTDKEISIAILRVS